MLQEDCGAIFSAASASRPCLILRSRCVALSYRRRPCHDAGRALRHLAIRHGRSIDPRRPQNGGECELRELWRTTAAQLAGITDRKQWLACRRATARGRAPRTAIGVRSRRRSPETANGRTVSSPAACVTIPRQPPWLPPLLRPFPPSRAEPVGLPEPWPCLPALRGTFDTVAGGRCHRPSGTYATVSVTMCRFGNSMDCGRAIAYLQPLQRPVRGHRPPLCCYRVTSG